MYLLACYLKVNDFLAVVGVIAGIEFGIELIEVNDVDLLRLLVFVLDS